MSFPVKFRKNDDKTVNYDWIDFTNGFGYKRFYGAAYWDPKDGGGWELNYVLSNETCDSGSGFAATYSGTWTYADLGTDIDCDFDITFNQPVTVAAAPSILNFSVYHSSAADLLTVVTVYHVSVAGVETSLGSWTQGEYTAAANEYRRELCKISLTKKVFGIGEKLRLNFVMTNDSAGVGDLKLYHDPESRQTLTDIQSLTIGTDLVFDVPFIVQN